MEMRRLNGKKLTQRLLWQCPCLSRRRSFNASLIQPACGRDFLKSVGAKCYSERVFIKVYRDVAHYYLLGGDHGRKRKLITSREVDLPVNRRRHRRDPGVIVCAQVRARAA